MPPSLPCLPPVAPATGATRRTGWRLPAGLLFSLLLLSRWSQPPVGPARANSAGPANALGRLPRPVLAPSPTSAL